MKFTDMKLSPRMQEALAAIGFEVASPVQVEVIPQGMKGKDIIGQAQTGTGKTAAFGIPIIENTIENEELQSIVLAPSRELATQIYKEFRKYTMGTEIRIAEIIGGVSYTTQERKLKRGVNIIVATPGRLMDMFDRVKLDLSTIKSFVLDEADEMLNFGFLKDIKKISGMMPEKVQKYFLTATFNAKIKKLASEILNNPYEVKISGGLTTASSVEQKYIELKEKQKLVAFNFVMNALKPTATVVFGRTRKRVDELAAALSQLGYRVLGIQGDMRQRERSNSMDKFRNGEIDVIIGTDVIARGIDVSHVDLVVNFDLPTEIEYYTHRIGRTGRADKKGTAISFVKPSEKGYFNQIQRATNSNPVKMPMPTDKEVAEMREISMAKDVDKHLKNGKKKCATLGARISKNYTKDELGIIVASLMLGDQPNEYEIKLTGQAGAAEKGKSKNSRNGRGGSGKNKNGRRRDNKKKQRRATSDDFKPSRPGSTHKHSGKRNGNNSNGKKRYKK